MSKRIRNSRACGVDGGITLFPTSGAKATDMVRPIPWRAQFAAVAWSCKRELCWTESIPYRGSTVASKLVHCFEVEAIVFTANGIESSSAVWALVGTFQILANTQFCSADAV